MTQVNVFDAGVCSLGEGALWHPTRNQFFWFDINNNALFTQDEGTRIRWDFDAHVTAAGWVNDTQLIIAHETSLLLFNIETRESEKVVDLEAADPITRSNDGRADPWGGFWIGTMGKKLEKDAGAIYRYYRGELRTLYAPWTIPNAQCFSPQRDFAYLTDTPNGEILKQRLDPKEGWPVGEPEVFITLPESEFRPDGAVVDAEGRIWIAHYGHGKITCHDVDGNLVDQIKMPANCITCPAFGGTDGTTLFATTAAQAYMPDRMSKDPMAGQTFVMDLGVKGQREHQVVL